ncbi:RNA polymerase sigma factor [Flavihumibacter sp. UBA7668]|uniref:RNA polymerase sigma factor n=1 Tax=Flavihumibacter sp. UBA7668 TaxID=1946542 RepID=UPI0025BFE153|nr:RNA polymerase sigma factor [Flavihumibacter sp. UBA7668]
MDVANLLIQIKDGNQAAEQALFNELSDRMLLLCLRYVKNREDAEELMLSGMLKLFQHLPGFEFQYLNGFYSWCRRIMVNECLMHLRKQHSFVMAGEPSEELAQEGEDILSKLDAADLFELILQLPPGYRTVFNLFVVEGYDHQEIAALLDISVGTSKSQLNKSRLLLQKNIAQKGMHHVRRKTI